MVSVQPRYSGRAENWVTKGDCHRNRSGASTQKPAMRAAMRADNSPDTAIRTIKRPPPPDDQTHRPGRVIWLQVPVAHSAAGVRWLFTLKRCPQGSENQLLILFP